MRIAVAISVAVHVVMLLWLILGPGARALSSASTEPVMVDLVSPKDAPKEAAEETKSKQSEPDQSKTDQAKADPPKADPPKPPDSSDPSNPPTDAAKKEAEQRVAAVRLARLLGVPLGPEFSLEGPPSDMKSSLTSQEIAGFKAQIRKCWVAPQGVPNSSKFNILMRVGLGSDGRLLTDPIVEVAPDHAVDAALALRDAATQALKRCQPYAGLPADKYQDWQILDMTFTARGPSGMAGETDQSLR